MDDQIVSQQLPPPAKECDTMYSLPSISNEEMFPFDLFFEGKKVKPIRASFYERLVELRGTERIFIKQVSKPVIKYIDQSCQFEVLNQHGKPIFFALDTTDAWASTVFEGTKPFNVMVLNYDYAEVLKITGPGLSRVHGSAWVKHSGQPLGRIVQEDHLCSFTPTYGIQGVSGITGLKIKGPSNSYATGMPKCPTFETYLMDESSVMGRISKQWVVFGPPSKEGAPTLPPEETYVVNFHPEMDLRTKCLLLSAVFMLDYQFYHKTIQAGVSRKCWITFTILFFSLVIFILVAVDLIKEYQLGGGNRNTTTASTSNTTSTLLSYEEFNGET